MLAGVQLPCGAWLGGGCSQSITFRAVLGGEQGWSLRKGMQTLFKRNERRLTTEGQVETFSVQPSPHPSSRHLFYFYFLIDPHSRPELLDWCGNHSWDLLRRYVTVQNAICPFPLPVKTRQPTHHLGTSRPAVLGVFGNDGFQRTFSVLVSDVQLTQFVLPSSLYLRKQNQSKQTYQPTNIFHAFFCF